MFSIFANIYGLVQIINCVFSGFELDDLEWDFVFLSETYAFIDARIVGDENKFYCMSDSSIIVGVAILVSNVRFAARTMSLIELLLLIIL